MTAGAAAVGAAAANVTDCSDAIGTGAVTSIAVTAPCWVLDKVGAAAVVLAVERSNEESHCEKINE